MKWLFLALLAPAVYTIVVFIDKYIVSKEVKDYKGMPIFMTFVGLIAGIIFWLITGFPKLYFTDLLLILGSGILTIWGSFFYFQAMSSDEASKVIILMQMIPIMILIFAYLFLNETISARQFVGFILILGSTTAVTIEKSAVSIIFSKTLFLMLLADLFWSIAPVLLKFTIINNSFSSILSYESWGIGIGGMFLYIFFPSIRLSFQRSLISIRKLAIGLIFLNEGIFLIAKSITYFAYSLGPIAATSVLGSTQVFYGVLLGWILTALAPEIIKEDISLKNLAKKTFLGSILFTGIWLVY